MNMRKSLLLAASAILMLLSACTGRNESVKFVTIDGTDLIAPDGSKLYIRGTNLGTWLNPEGYMFGFSKTSSPRLINEMFCELVGPDFTADFWKTFKDNYVTREDIEFIHSCGANTIRIPFNYRIFTDEDYMGLTHDQNGFEMIDRVVGWCRDLGMFVVLDMHDAPGGQTGDNIDDSYGYPWLMESQKSQDEFCQIWKNIADHYKNEPAVLGYELLNEPIATYFDADKLNPVLQELYKRATAAIREVDGNHIIILGAPQWNTNFSALTDWQFDDKIMFTCHRYGGEATEESIQSYIDFQHKTNLPMYMGEIGHNSREWQEAFASILEKNNIGYTFWPYKMMRRGGMVSIGTPEGWDKIVRFSEGDRSSFGAVRDSRPDQDSSRVILTQYLESCRFPNCKIDTSYINSMKLSVK